jgi:methionyl aminopeptidase
MKSTLVKPGVPYRKIGDIIQAHADKHGFSVVKTYCGHGIGRLFHGPPSVPHYASKYYSDSKRHFDDFEYFFFKDNRAVGTMKAGHVFTIEPMISEGSWKDQLWPDGWTSVTIDGKRSAQFEHTILVTPTGHEVLTR